MNEVYSIVQNSGLSITDIAKTMGVTRATIYSWMRGTYEINKRDLEYMQRHVQINKLAHLEQACDDAINAASSAGLDACVNWLDLMCCFAERYYASNGVSGYRVYIEEAAPENHEFKKFIMEHMATNGYENIEVVTEW
jgi:transcriptional regulator with XRE-family HTH domain